jgi:hypothetical protein
MVGECGICVSNPQDRRVDPVRHRLPDALGFGSLFVGIAARVPAIEIGYVEFPARGLEKNQ